MLTTSPRTPRRFRLPVFRGFSSASWAVYACFALVLTATGCGTGEYGSRVQKNLDGMLVGSVFTNLYEKPTPIPDASVQIRLPKLVSPEAKAYNDKSPGVDPRQLQPPGMRIPGLKVTYEMNATGETEGPLNYYLYLAAFRPGESVPGGGALADTLQKQLAAAFPSAGASQWADVESLTPDLNKIVWKRIQVSGDQEFATGTAGEFKKLPGNLTLFLYEADGNRVLVGWRVPAPLEKQIKADDLAKSMCGTVEFGAAPAQ